MNRILVIRIPAFAGRRVERRGMTATKSCTQTDYARGDHSELDVAPLLGVSPSSRSARPGVWLSICFTALALASAARAQVTVVEDFESYADSTALRAAWVAIAPLPSSSVTLDTSGITGQSMNIAYDVSVGTNAVEFTFGSDQDYS